MISDERGEPPRGPGGAAAAARSSRKEGSIMFITSYKATLQKNRLMALEPVRDYLCGDGDDKITSTATAAHVLVNCLRLHEEAEEHMVVLCMNASGRITGVFETTSGGINAVHFDITGIMRKVLMMNCVSFIMAHNHPGESLSPSPEDLAATETARKAAELLGLKLLDHFIVSGITGDYLSFREEGYMS